MYSADDVQSLISEKWEVPGSEVQSVGGGNHPPLSRESVVGDCPSSTQLGQILSELGVDTTPAGNPLANLAPPHSLLKIHAQILLLHFSLLVNRQAQVMP